MSTTMRHIFCEVAYTNRPQALAEGVLFLNSLHGWRLSLGIIVLAVLAGSTAKR